MTLCNIIILITQFGIKIKITITLFLEKASYEFPRISFWIKYKLLYHNKTDASEETNINKTSASKGCDICHYWYFLNKEFTFQPYACNRCQDLLMVSMNLSHIYILNIQNVDCCIVNGISKSEATKLLQNIVLTENSEYYKEIKIKSNFEAANLLQILI